MVQSELFRTSALKPEVFFMKAEGNNKTKQNSVLFASFASSQNTCAVAAVRKFVVVSKV